MATLTIKASELQTGDALHVGIHVRTVSNHTGNLVCAEIGKDWRDGAKYYQPDALVTVERPVTAREKFNALKRVGQ